MFGGLSFFYVSLIVAVGGMTMFIYVQVGWGCVRFSSHLQVGDLIVDNGFLGLLLASCFVCG